MAVAVVVVEVDEVDLVVEDDVEVLQVVVMPLLQPPLRPLQLRLPQKLRRLPPMHPRKTLVAETHPPD